MKKTGYILFGSMAVVGVALVFSSFTRYEPVLVSQFVVGFITATVGIIGCVWLDHIGKVGDKNGSYLSTP